MAEFDAVDAAALATTFFADPFGTAVRIGLASSRDEVDLPQWIGEGGPDACLFQDPVTFVWPRDPVYGPPDAAGLIPVLSSTPTLARRPRDARNPNAVCSYTGANPDAVAKGIPLGDRAANWYNFVRPTSDVGLRLLSQDLTPRGDDVFVNPFTGERSSGLGAQILALQAHRRALTSEQLQLEQFGVVAAAPSSGAGIATMDETQVYEYRSVDGTLKPIPLGTFDLAREIAALRACEAQPGGGVGTRGTANCFQQLLFAAGGPRLVAANEAPAFGTYVLAPELAQAGRGLRAIGAALTPVNIATAVSTLAATSSAPVMGASQPLAAPAPRLASDLSLEELGSVVTLNSGGSSMTFAPLGGYTDSFSFSLPSSGPVSGDSAYGGGGGSGSVLGDWVDGIPVVGGALGDLLEAVTSPEILGVVSGLSRAGVIRGSIGQAFAPTGPIVNAAPAAGGGFSPTMAINLAALAAALAQSANGADVASTDDNDFDMGELGSLGLEALQAIQRNVFGQNTAQVPDASNLFRARPMGAYLPRRIQVRGPDGSIYVLLNAGKATRGSREKSLARSLARDNGYVCHLRGSGYRSRRRPR